MSWDDIPIFFVIYINNLLEVVKCDTYFSQMKLNLAYKQPNNYQRIRRSASIRDKFIVRLVPDMVYYVSPKKTYPNKIFVFRPSPVQTLHKK